MIALHVTTRLPLRRLWRLDLRQPLCRSQTGETLTAMAPKSNAHMKTLQLPAECWLHNEVEVWRSRIEGSGLFARTSFPEGTRILQFGGEIITRESLLKLISARESNSELPYVDSVSVAVGLDLLIAPSQEVHFLNHSCDPTAWHVDAFTLESRRAIGKNAEITVDYAPQVDSSEFAMECNCGSPECRGLITGEDWTSQDLRTRYGDHWVPVLLARIRAAKATNLNS